MFCPLVWQGAPSPTFDQTTSSSVSLISKRLAHHDGQRLWVIASSVALPPPNCFVPLHPHTVGNAPQCRFCWNRWWGTGNWGDSAKANSIDFFIRSCPSPSYSAAQSCKPSSSAAILIRHRRLPPSPSLSAAAVFHPCSHHCHSAVFSISCHHRPFPTVVHHPILRAFIIHC